MVRAGQQVCQFITRDMFKINVNTLAVPNAMSCCSVLERTRNFYAQRTAHMIIVMAAQLDLAGKLGLGDQTRFLITACQPEGRG